MFRKKHHTLFVWTVMVLLGFTAADLSGDLFGSEVCAADADRHDAAEGAASQRMSRTAGNDEDGNQPPPHVDDCFCCSRCVESSSQFTLDAEFSRVEALTPSRVQKLYHLLSQLYRPPRAS